ncbi:molybdopterin-dependent oxidoreductase [Hymenobacter taeanensis]|uniref:Molybdopterin-dependent oxidoreductase n=1 Tax=Hymenobacter taeanensis TaxID=2735321 RepID=A0A6M6BIL8_9BACT|nr:MULTISPECIES: nitrate reductase [Hymenobacter]QJX47728.1 molybdopterin-dependent oxidoreductase [Hymenobacter taeanensis]UOQ82786.1 nitrate reductase [Hymenobacter sp. 5414T-23]
MKETRDSIDDIWGSRTGYEGQWPVRVDERIEEEPDHWVQSACVLCSNGCGMDIGVKEGRIVGVRGRAEDRVNHGRLGPKGLHSWVANHSQDRLTKPLIRRNGKLEEASWEEAMSLIVQKSKELVQKHTASSIGFYTSGQLLLEEYYALGVLGKAGLGTPHMDGNTRLCTATAAAALKVSFGSDGQPGSYTDLDTTEAVLLVGHNMASQQTVLWTRILDRLAGPNPPHLVVIDPRLTYTAEKATVHLAPRAGTNVPLMNGLLHLIIEAGHINQSYIEAHTQGFEELKKIVSKWTPERVEQLTGVPAEKLLAAARILGTCRTLVSTALQGVYQSMQATAAAVQVNNLHLLRGLLGHPGSGIYQMNGQPTAQNTRECGADGDLPAFRNWGNEEHIKELAKLWNVHPDQIPHWSPPTHAMQIWRYCEQGSIKMLWISGTNPLVSLPELDRVRKIIQQESLFVVVQDAFPTETTQYADVVLPAAIWGEKTGTFTNVDRTVHITHKAIDPPGEARPDFDIFVDYARRMDFRGQDGSPLLVCTWKTPEDAFNAWRECTRGRPCDYTGLSYAKLTGGSGIQWPCNEQYPNGKTHLYEDGVFNTAIDYCETYGHDLETGAPRSHDDYKLLDPQGKAFLKGSDYEPPHEVPDEQYPLWLTTGRLVYHFHTRTKTGRSRALNHAAPDGFVQLSAEDAARYGIQDGDMVEVESRRGKVQEPARIGGTEPGLVFIPFHYGYWDKPGRPRAANELTITEWDAVSKQPHYKYAAVRIRKVNA